MRNVLCVGVVFGFVVGIAVANIALSPRLKQATVDEQHAARYAKIITTCLHGGIINHNNEITAKCEILSHKESR